MNKYNLHFEDSKLEYSYQNYIISKIQFPIFQFFVGLLQIYFLIQLILQLLDQNYVESIKRVGAILIITLNAYIVFKNEKFVNQGLFVFNILLLALELSQNEIYDHYNLYLFGTNNQTIHCMLVSVQLLEYGFVCNIMLCLTRIIITTQYAIIYPSQFVITIIITISFQFIIYRVQQLLRTNFLLTLKEDQWGIILPQILQKPFIIFTFDTHLFTYNLRMLNQIDFPFPSTNIISEFLKQCNYGKQTLQDYLFKEIIQKQLKKSRQCRGELEVVYQKKTIQLLFFCYMIDQPNIILILQSEDKKLMQIKEQYKQKTITFNKLLQNYFLENCKLIIKSVQNDQPLLINQLFFSLKQNYFLHNIKQTFQSINLNKILIKNIKQLKKMKYNVIYQKSEQQYLIIQNKSQLEIFFTEIFKLFKSRQQYQLKIIKNVSSLILIINGLNQLPATEIYWKCYQQVVKQHFLVLQTITFILQDQQEQSFYYNNQI